MQTVVHAVFANRSQAVGASEALRQAGFHPGELTLIGASDKKFQQVAAVAQSDKQDRLMIQLGLGGAFIGCIVGFLALPHMPARELMYLPIVNLIFTYWGLAIGLFTAMGIARFKQVTALTAAEANIPFAVLQPDDVYVSFNTANDSQARTQAQSLAAQHGATCLFVEVLSPLPQFSLSVAENAAAAPLAVLSKTA